MAQVSEAEARLVVIDDASPNGALRGWLDVQAASGQLELIRNPVNLGFAVSVNRALKICGGGDVVLLNADALPPPSALAAPRRLAQLRAGVGALSPLSNNGETCSFPAPNAASPLPPPDESRGWTRWRSGPTATAAIDLPNGDRLLPLYHPRLPRRRRPAAGNLWTRLLRGCRILPACARKGFSHRLRRRGLCRPCGHRCPSARKNGGW